MHVGLKGIFKPSVCASLVLWLLFIPQILELFACPSCEAAFCVMMELPKIYNTYFLAIVATIGGML